MLIDELRDLRYFVEVARCQSFSAAAIRLSVSSGTISKAIARLEEHMHAALFVRSSRALRLTSEGEALFARVDAAYHALDVAWSEHGAQTGVVSGTVHLSTFSIYGRTHLARLLPGFLRDNPEIEVVVSIHDNWRSTSRDRADIRITWHEPLDEDKVAQNLAPQEFILVGGADYVARRGKPASVADLSGHDCIGGIGHNGSRIHWYFLSPDGQYHDFMPQGRVALMDEMSMAINFAQNDMGLTLVDPEDVRLQLKEGSLIRLLETYAITTRNRELQPVILQYPPRHRQSRATELLVDRILEYHSATA